MKLKFLIIFIILTVCGVFFVSLNITEEYPMKKVCEQIRDFNKKKNHVPTLEEFNAMNVPEVRFVSTIKYRKTDNDFVFYFCPTYLGPCEVCTLEDGPYFDEI